VPLLIALSLWSSADAAQAPTEDSLWYYEIGGAEPVSAPANPAVVPVTLGGSAQLGLGYSCRKFDPVAAVTNTLNDIGAGVDNMMNAMTAAASAAIAALPALILQRANPGLYDLFQNALLQAEETMQLATKSCEQMEAEIAQGKNPYADLITLSKGNDWKLQMGIGGNDAVTAKDAVETSNGDNGVPWIGSQAGGSGQPVLEFTGDIVKAGYNVNMNRPVTATGAVPPASMTRLSEVWATPTDARDWVVEVVGENIVTTCDTCRKDSIPGTGPREPGHHHRTRRGHHAPGHRSDSGDASLRAEFDHGAAGFGDQYCAYGGKGPVRPTAPTHRPAGAGSVRHRSGPRTCGYLHRRT
jgi:integrating conjugative element protein (TIGR03755 family)